MRLRERSSPSGRTCGEAVRWHWTCRRTFVRRNHCAVGLCPTDHDGPSPDSLEIERLSLVVTAAGADTCSVSGRLQLDVFSFLITTSAGIVFPTLGLIRREASTKRGEHRCFLVVFLAALERRRALMS